MVSGESTSNDQRSLERSLYGLWKSIGETNGLWNGLWKSIGKTCDIRDSLLELPTWEEVLASWPTEQPSRHPHAHMYMGAGGHRCTLALSYLRSLARAPWQSQLHAWLAAGELGSQTAPRLYAQHEPWRGQREADTWLQQAQLHAGWPSENVAPAQRPDLYTPPEPWPGQNQTVTWAVSRGRAQSIVMWPPFAA